MTAKADHSFHYAWIVLVMGTLVVFGALGLARFGYTTVLPSMQKSLAMDNSQAGLLATGNLAGYLILSMIGGGSFAPVFLLAAGIALLGALGSAALKMDKL